MIFIVSYDLNKQGQKYTELIDAIKQYHNWACLGGSAYIIETNKSHVEVRDDLGHHIDGNDKLFVGQLSAPAAWRGYSDEVSNWILTKLK